MKILIIEDEILIQKSLQKLLTRKGHDTTATASGIEGIQLIKNESYDRIICDLMLNDITGFDILEESKAIYNSEEISQKFIIMTAYSSAQVLSQVEKYKCIFLKKPFDSLTDTIEILVGENEKRN